MPKLFAAIRDRVFQSAYDKDISQFNSLGKNNGFYRVADKCNNLSDTVIIALKVNIFKRKLDRIVGCTFHEKRNILYTLSGQLKDNQMLYLRLLKMPLKSGSVTRQLGRLSN